MSSSCGLRGRCSDDLAIDHGVGDVGLDGCGRRRGDCSAERVTGSFVPWSPSVLTTRTSSGFVIAGPMPARAGPSSEPPDRKSLAATDTGQSVTLAVPG